MLASALSVTAISVAGGLGVFGAPATGSDATAGRGDSVAGRTAPRASSTSPIADGGARIAATSGSTALPASSGKGRRVVFSESAQRVWLVEEGPDGDRVARTHLASGSIYDNLEPGTYEVFSRSRHAVGVDDSGTMEYFVRFTYGDEGAAIGFHSIPVDDGEPVQRIDQLGTPLSHGCIRQRRADAIEVWDFAPIGTTVVVTA